MCVGHMRVVYDSPTTKVCICVDCHTAISVPGEAWAVAHSKGAAKRHPDP